MLDSGKAYFMHIIYFYRKSGNKPQQGNRRERFGKTAELTNRPVATEILAAEVIDAYKNAVNINFKTEIFNRATAEPEITLT